jgi:tagatose 1,6-diphosphate aldolase GatY/KbaY
MNIKSKLVESRVNRTAILATNFYNIETLLGTVRAATSLNKPLILQLTKSSIDYMGLNVAVKLARTVIQDYNLEAWIHLDHAESFELIKRCLEAGFDSVMIDASNFPLSENIKRTVEVINYAKSFGAAVEAELGYVAKLGQDSGISAYTDPDEAKLFVEETGVDFLAVAIGTSHGFYKAVPLIDLNRLFRIASKVSVPLVLHGSSGVPEDTVKNTISLGIAKINLATEIKNIFMLQLKNDLANSDEIDLRKVFPAAIDKVTELVRNKIINLNI